MRYYIIAGEASGDLHGSNLIAQLKLQDENFNARCWGGDLMLAQGTTVVKHFKELAFMGFLEVVKNLSTILKNINFCKKDIEVFEPDVLILIDYPGFNLRIAEWAKKKGYKVVYYIAPQVWAWKANRVKKMKQYIDLMLCILPFEKAYFKDVWNWDVSYVGHPLIEVIDSFKLNNNHLQKENIIAIVPGSRKQEIAKKLPIMLQVSKLWPQYNFVVAKAPGLEDDFYAGFLQPYSNVSAVSNKTYELLSKAQAAMVTSGTATLETALFNVPEVVCYKTSNISYAIGKRLIKIKFIALVNLIMNKLVVKELIQKDLTPNKIAEALNPLLLIKSNEYNQQQNDYKNLYQLLSNGGFASKQAATKIKQFLEQKS